MSVRKPDIREAIQTDSRAIKRVDSLPEAVPFDKSMAIYHIRFQKHDMEILSAYLKRQGLGLSAGVRMAVAQFMQKAGLK